MKYSRSNPDSIISHPENLDSIPVSPETKLRDILDRNLVISDNHPGGPDLNHAFVLLSRNLIPKIPDPIG